MRSLVFIALLGLALAVPVPHAAVDESEIFASYELPDDCYADTNTYEHAETEDDLQIDNITEEDNENCNDDPIIEEDLIDIQIDYQIQPGNNEDDIIYTQEYEPIEDEDCVDENVPTEQPPVITEAEPQIDDNSDCYGEDYSEIILPDAKEEPQLEPLNTDVFERGFLEVDQVFNTEFEQEAEGIEECVEY